MTKYVVIKLTDLSDEQVELMAAMLPEFGFHGLEEIENGVLSYAKIAEADLEGLTGFLKTLGVSHTTDLLEEQNWNASWEANFDPVIIPGRVHVRAHFHPSLEGFEHEITITPKMSFGTGHHATTRMMMQAILDTAFQGKSVLDFGTGTGILSILAILRGAKHVHAVDNDEWSVNNALENIAINEVDTKISVSLVSDLQYIPACDVILANINKHVLLDHVTAMSRVLKEEGTLIVSGLLSADYDDIATAFEPFFGKARQVLNEQGWIAIVFVK
jgi:ribosomal protein L11 methyltransferase